jgi:ElaB/YqjD/DUF883 family membrane-anchored ribosome-binding protein
MLFNGRESSAAARDVKRDLQLLRDDVSKLAEQISGDLGHGGNEVLTQARESIDYIRQSLNEVMARTRDPRGVANNIAASLEDSLRTRPLSTLALAVGVAFIFGAAWRHRG